MKRKRLISLFIIICMMVSLLPTFASAAAVGTTFTAGNFTYTVNDASTVTLTAIAVAQLPEAVTVPQTVSDGTTTYTVTKLGDAFKDQGAKTYGMKTLVLPDTITHFTGKGTFYSCTNLKSIHLPANLTGDATGTGYLTNTFHFCAYLSQVELPVGITKCYGTFKQSCGTRTVTIKGKSQVDFFAGSGTKDARAWADGITGITIYYPADGVAPTRYTGSFTATIKTYGNSTFNAGNFTYSVNDASTVTLTQIAAAKLTGAVTVPSTVSDGVKTYTVTKLGDAFKNQGAKTEEMTDLVLPDTITEFTGTGTFYGCKFKSIHLPANLEKDGNKSYANCLYNTFQYCTQLTEVELPAKIVRCFGTFRNSAVKTVTITGKSAVDFYGGSGTSDARAWTDNTTGIIIYYPADGTIPTRYSGSFTATPVPIGQPAVVSQFEVGDFKYKVIEDTETVTVLGFSSTSDKAGAKVLPATVTYQDVTYTVTKVGYAAFANNTNLTSFVMPDTVTTIDVNVFYGCSKLASVHLSENITNAPNSQLVGTFYGCKALKTVVVPKGIGTLSKTFLNSGIENVVLTAKFTSIAGKEYFAFSNPDTVKVFYRSDATLGFGTNAYITNTFIYDENNIAYKQKADGTLAAVSVLPASDVIGAVSVPSAVGSLKVTEIANEAFKNADSITSITVPDSVVTIGESAFEGCDSLESVTLPKNLPGVMKNTFKDCTALTSVIIPEGIVTLDGTFAGCTDLTSIKFAQTVSTISNKAFYGCSSLTELVVPNTVTTISDGTNGAGTVFPDGITLIVQEESEALRYADTNNIDYLVKPAVEYSVKNGSAELTKTYFRLVGEYTIPASVTIGGTEYTVTSIASEAFSDQDALTCLFVPDTVSVISEDAFVGCDNADFAVRTNSGTQAYAAAKTLPVTYIVDDEESGLAYKKYASVNGLEICSTANDTQLSGAVSIEAFDGLDIISIGEGAFRGQSGITSVTMADTVTTIGKSAFEGCESLVEATLSSNAEGILDSTFVGCESLEEVDIPAGITALRNTYNGCTSLTRVIIPGTLTAIYENSFANCTGLETVVIPATVTTFDRIIGFKDQTQQQAEYVETNTGKQWVDNPFKGATNENLAICGTRGSAAEEFAYSSGIKFIDVTAGDYPFEYSKVGTNSFKVTVRDIYNQGDIAVIGALYQGDQLVQCQPLFTDFNSDGCKTVFETTMPFTQYDETTTLKFMTWNFEGLKPVNNLVTEKTPEKIKILVLGNSISLHGPSPSVGWFAPDGQGMAATSLATDYVHVLLSKAQEVNPNVEVKVVSAWSLEANFHTWETVILSADYQEAIEYDADIIIAQFGENVKNNANEGSLGGDDFENENEFTSTIFADIVKAFIKDGKDVPVLVVTSMMSNVAPVLEAKQEACEENGWAYVNLCNDTNFKESKNSAYYLTPSQVEIGIANGTFQEGVTIGTGVYVHPGDNGMRAMANGLWKYLEPIVREMTFNN